MKAKQLLSVVLWVATVSSFAQGTVSVQNTPGTLVQYQTNFIYQYPYPPPELAPVPVGGGYVELLWAPLGTSDLSLFTSLGSPILITPIAGRFAGGVRTIPAGTGFNGIAPGDTVSAVLRGWTGTAPTWNQAMFSTALLGYSAIFTVDTGNPLTNPGEIPGSIVSSTANGFAGLNLVFIPEPASAALLLLGAGLFVPFRRRPNNSAQSC